MGLRLRQPTVHSRLRQPTDNHDYDSLPYNNDSVRYNRFSKVNFDNNGYTGIFRTENCPPDRHTSDSTSTKLRLIVQQVYNSLYNMSSQKQGRGPARQITLKTIVITHTIETMDKHLDSHSRGWCECYRTRTKRHKFLLHFYVYNRIYQTPSSFVMYIIIRIESEIEILTTSPFSPRERVRAL